MEGNNTSLLRISIMEAVSKPIIKINSSGLHGNSFGRNCSFHVNCSSSGSWAAYSCDENHCSPLRSSPLATGVNITVVSGNNGHIECNASNLASKETGRQQLPEDCLEDGSAKQSPDPDLRWTVLLSVIVASLLLLVCVILIVRTFRKKPSGMEDTPHKHHDIPTVIVTESDADEPSRQEVNSVYSVVNKAARCLVSSHDAPIKLKNQTSRPVDTEGEHRAQRQQRNRRKQRPQEDKNMTIYTTATNPLEKQHPLEDTDRTIYTTATKPLEKQHPLEDTDRTIYDTTRTQQNAQLPPLVTNTSQTETNQADTVYYTLGHMNSGQH
ncbi:uncharacterized protein si:ch1073-220m6.1 [Clupea harengus]|uniref:Uncharacterized protein si:ch1073-220m6.1 n=1 Tax=Clupea harengus TaxID=7950 RepID=A0A6P8GNK3_CLUHA|nr:uncharacterized protein si:ch1073-220m6.1 [Clupea harengus]XP_031440804.1 uncharacterized protein si:ch1073-220m6.1 [Clupea harengus]